MDCADVPDEKKAQLYRQKEALNTQVVALDNHNKKEVDKKMGQIDSHTKELKKHMKVMPRANTLNTMLIITIILSTIVAAI